MAKGSNWEGPRADAGRGRGPATSRTGVGPAAPSDAPHEAQKRAPAAVSLLH